MLAPAPVPDPAWLHAHPAYTLQAFTRAMYAVGWAEELKGHGVACNCVWPAFCVQGWAGDAGAEEDSELRAACGVEAPDGESMGPGAVAEAAARVLAQPPKEVSGRFFLDVAVLAAAGWDEGDILDLRAAAGGGAMAPNHFTTRLSAVRMGTKLGEEGVPHAHDDPTLPGYGGEAMDLTPKGWREALGAMLDGCC